MKCINNSVKINLNSIRIILENYNCNNWYIVMVPIYFILMSYKNYNYYLIINLEFHSVCNCRYRSYVCI